MARKAVPSLQANLALAADLQRRRLDSKQKGVDTLIAPDIAIKGVPKSL